MDFYAAAAADAPNWADKLEAWSTFGGAIFTAVAVIVAFLVWRHDQHVRREEELNTEAAQARLVINKVASISGSREAGWLGVSYEVLNNSAGRITDVYTALSLSDGSSVILEVDVGELGPGERHDEQFRFDEPAPWRFSIPSYSRPPAWSGRIVLGVDMQTRFVDSSGVRWYRDNGQEPCQSLRRERISTRSLLGDYLHVTTVLFWIRAIAKGFVLGLRLMLHARLRKRAEKARSMRR